MNRPSRRAFLASAAATSGALAGCSSLLGDDGDASTLDSLRVANRDIRAHTVHVYVEYDDHDPMVWQSHDLAPPGADRSSETTVDFDWPDEPGRYTVRARVDDDRNWQSFTEVGDPDCAAFELDVLEGGKLLGTTPSAAACPLGDA